MNQGPERYHLFIIGFQIGKYIKNSFILILFLFILNYQSDMFLWKYGRYIFLLVTIWSFASYGLQWFFRKYEMTETAFYLYEGVFTKEERIIPYDRVQDIKQRRSFVHRILGHSSLRFETAMAGQNDSISFPTLPKREAENIKVFVEQAIACANKPDEEATAAMPNQLGDAEQPGRDVHFTPSARDLLFAFLTSFKFLALLPVLLSVYSRVESEFNLDKHINNVQSFFISAWWLTGTLILFLVLFSILIGVVQIYLKYGKYEIASDEFNIYITQGVINETAFSIRKNNVQAVKLEQSFMKRLLGMVEIKFISAGSLETNVDERQVNSLYPFLRKERAFRILHELLPDYQVGEKINRHPVQKLWMNIMKLSLVSALLIGMLYLLQVYQVISLPLWVNIGVWVLFAYAILVVYLHYRCSGYSHQGKWIQVRKGALTTTLFITKREKLIGLNTSQSLLQKAFRLANIEIINRSTPVEYTTIAQLSAREMRPFLIWYQQRANEIDTE